MFKKDYMTTTYCIKRFLNKSTTDVIKYYSSSLQRIIQMNSPLIPVANLPPVSTTPAVLAAKFAAGVVDTSGKFAAGGIDTGGKFAANFQINSKRS
jgi:hypothetical protein